MSDELAMMRKYEELEAEIAELRTKLKTEQGVIADLRHTLARQRSDAQFVIERLKRDLDHERSEKYTAQGIAAQERLKRADISQVSAAQE